MKPGDTLTVTNVRGPLVRAFPRHARDLFLTAPRTLKATYYMAAPQYLTLDGDVEVGKTLTVIAVADASDRRDVPPTRRP